ncbi:MAG: CoB--CoM heterodisulfide reductase iron-sulfur subunit A family protein [Anaerolineales bacterium]|nr:CoB--CoM heterodisulfide reductase iron-sulfur subunit A family protein [Anaerolineales bacterium]
MQTSNTTAAFTNGHLRSEPPAAMVIGGGIGGMRAALDLADAGLKVYLVEHTPCLGGRVAQLGFMFPQHDCVLCRGTPDHGYGCTRPSISPAYIQQNQHPNIQILTNTRVTEVQGQAGNFTVSLRQEPRYVDPARCINCGYCSQVCPIELPDSYQQGLAMRKAAYKISARAAPDAYVIDRGPYCDDCGKCVEVCPTNAIDLEEQPRLLTVAVGAIILALGFQIYDATELGELGFGRYPNVLNAMQYERLASRSGPTEGILVRPSDNQRPRSIAWLQCIGSRDRKNSYCSSICCMYATKEAILAKQRLGAEVECSVFIMDERAFNKEYSNYFAKARQKHGIHYNRCRVSAIHEDPQTHNLTLDFADENGQPRQESFDLVVLAIGLQPPESAADLARMLGIGLDSSGFCKTDKFTPLQTTRPGVFVCGAFSTPKEIAETILDASGAAAEVMRLLNDRLNTYPYNREWPFLSTETLPPERDVSDEPPRIGIFVCTCAGTIDGTEHWAGAEQAGQAAGGRGAIDLRGLAEQAATWPSVVYARVIRTACFPEDIVTIKEQILEHNLNRVVIAACSNRTHDPLFQRAARQAGLNPYLVELVNLREQCSSVHQWQGELANRKARELVRVAVGRVTAAQPVHKQKHRSRPAALVIGGGVSGMTAALAIADSGYDVHLVERTEMLGGNLLTLYYVAEGYNPQLLLRDLVNRIRSHQRIYTYTFTEVARQSGHVGFFRTELLTRLPNGETETTHIEHGVTIVATGGREGRNHPWLSYPQVITQRELEEKIIHHPEEITNLKNVVMIQCVRPEGVPDYCSRVCCTNTMKNAIRIKLFNPGCNVSVLYRNIVTYGFREQYYTEARRRGVVFIRYTDEQPPRLVYDQHYDQLRVKLRDMSLDRWLDLPADLVPLSTSIQPSIGTRALADMLRVPLSSEGFFEEAQMKLRPMDFMRDGVFLAGMAHYPKFLEESISHSLAAAARALSLLSAHEELYLGGVVAQVDPDKCVGCLTCTRVCPFSIPQVIQQEGRHGVGKLGGAAYIDPAQCQGCGTCTGECPANAIQLVNYTDEQIMLHDIGGLGQWLPQVVG